MTTVQGVGRRWRSFLIILGAISLAIVLSSCSSSKSAEPQTGTLLRTFTLVDEQGQKSGTLVFNPLGSAELRDVNGTLIGTLAPQPSASGGAMPQPGAKP